MVTGCLLVDLSREPEDVDRHDRHQLSELFGAPDGAHVRVDVGARWFPWDSTVYLLRQHADRVQVEVVGSTVRAVRAWVAAIQPEPQETYDQRIVREDEEHRQRALEWAVNG